MKNIIFFFSILFFIAHGLVYPQDVDIIPYLKQIESGERDEVLKELPDLTKKNPESPSVKFLTGILEENAVEAVKIFEEILLNHSQSKYADASLYRIYSYYYAIGSYQKSKAYLERLKNEYPESPYIKIADRVIPDSEDVFADKQQGIDVKVTEQKIKPVHTELSRFRIQAGAFSNEENAINLKKDFEDSGFKTIIEEKLVGGTLFRVVYVGDFTSEDEARNILQVINREFKLDGRIVIIN